MKKVDEHFYARADAHIHLSNDQLRSEPVRGKVSASMLYATARFNAWITACGSASGADLSASRNETIEYFVEQFRLMLEENIDDYITHFAAYMKPPPPQ